MARAIRSNSAGLSRWINYGIRRLRDNVGKQRCPIDVLALAERILGLNPVALDDSIDGETFLRQCSCGGVQLLIKRGPDIRFRIVSGLAQYILNTNFPDRVIEYPERELISNRIAASVLAPAKEIRAVCPPIPPQGDVSAAIPELAAHFGVTSSCIFLRIGEVFGDERALITRSGDVIVRTRGAVDWAEIPLADVAAGRPWKGLRCTRLTGRDEGRIAVRAVS
jgi:hypothetical protein